MDRGRKDTKYSPKSSKRPKMNRRKPVPFWMKQRKFHAEEKDVYQAGRRWARSRVPQYVPRIPRYEVEFVDPMRRRFKRFYDPWEDVPKVDWSKVGSSYYNPIVIEEDMPIKDAEFLRNRKRKIEDLDRTDTESEYFSDNDYAKYGPDDTSEWRDSHKRQAFDDYLIPNFNGRNIDDDYDEL